MIQTLSALQTVHAPIAAELERVEHRFSEELGSNFSFVTELCERVQRYRGKMLRPTLVLLTGRACGGVSEDHVTIAAVVEMVHVATLIHDDVLDEAGVRRGQATINAREGNQAAVLLGDYLMSHAFHLVAGLDDPYAARRMAATTNTVCEGELMQVHHRADVHLSEEQYFEIISRKTAALTATCCELGARYAGVSADQVTAWERFGADVGVAFQIADDVLDYTGSEDQMGKTLGRDLELGEPTLPTIHALRHADPAVRQELSSVLGNGHSIPRRRICAWLEAAGSLEYSHRVAHGYISRARDHLLGLPRSPARDALLLATDFMIRRAQ